MRSNEAGNNENFREEGGVQRYSFGNVLRENFHEYCENTTIHGVRYVGEGKIVKR